MTSNSDNQTDNTLLQRRKTTITLILAIVLVSVFGMLRPTRPQGIYPCKYWVMKKNWHNNAEMVLAGDSRTLMGLSPAVMEKHLTNRKILNFCYGAAGYSTEYLDAIERVLNTGSKNPAIMLGITPLSLSEPSIEINQFIQDSAMTNEEQFFNYYLPFFIEFFQYMSFNDARQGLFPSTKPAVKSLKYHPDGWVAGNKEPIKERANRRMYKQYRRLFQAGMASKRIQDIIIARVKKWVDSGIKVYGLRPPSCKGMMEVEDKYGGWDQQAFVVKFEACGGIWIDTDLTGYISFDGSHLRYDSAIELSERVAKKIVKLEQ